MYTSRDDLVGSAICSVSLAHVVFLEQNHDPSAQCNQFDAIKAVCTILEHLNKIVDVSEHDQLEMPVVA